MKIKYGSEFEISHVGASSIASGLIKGKACVLWGNSSCTLVDVGNLFKAVDIFSVAGVRNKTV